MSSHHHIFDDMSGAGGGSSGLGSHSHHHHSHHNHAHSRGQNTRSNSSSSNCQLRGKWEILLVFIVIFSGIVLTTLAVIKAKEKRNTSQIQQIPAENTILPVIERSSSSPSSPTSSTKFATSTTSLQSSTIDPFRTHLSVEKVNDISKRQKIENRRKKTPKPNAYEIDEPPSSVESKTSPKNKQTNQKNRKNSPIEAHKQNQESPQLPTYEASATAGSSVHYTQLDHSAADAATFGKQAKLKPEVDYGGHKAVRILTIPPGRHYLPSEAERTFPGAGFHRQIIYPTTMRRQHDTTFAGSSESAQDLTPESSSRHAVHISDPRVQNRVPFENRFALDPNTNYMKQEEILWLQQARPEIFQTSNRILGQQPVVPFQSRQHTINLLRNQRLQQLHRTRRAALDYRASNKHRKNSSKRRNSKRRKNNEIYNDESDSRQNLYSVASRKVEKRYGILGSGNFEIIRGGILPEEAIKSSKSKEKTLREPENSLNTNTDIENDGTSEGNGDSTENNNNDNNDTENGTNSDVENQNKQAEEQNDNLNEDNLTQDDNDEDNGNNNPLDDTFVPLNLDIFGNQDPFAGLQTNRNNVL